MIAEDIKTSNNIIAKFIGFQHSEVEPDYWYCDHYGLSLLKFHEEWEWLMYAIIKIQQIDNYKLQNIPYDIKAESLLLSKYISKLKSNLLHL
jgi:hypothetical protein